MTSQRSFQAIEPGKSFVDLSVRHQKLLRGTLWHKLDVLQRIDNGSLRVNDAAKELNCSPSAVSLLCRPSQREKLGAFVQKYPGSAIHRRMKRAKYEELEQELVQWIEKIQNLFDQLHFGVGMRMIQHYATKLAQEKGYSDFSQDSGWFTRFCGRHRVHRLRLHGEGGDVNVEQCMPAVLKLRVELSSYQPADIYNMDETGLFFK